MKHTKIYTQCDKGNMGRMDGVGTGLGILNVPVQGS